MKDKLTLRYLMIVRTVLSLGLCTIVMTSNAQRVITGKVLNQDSDLPVENVAVSVFMGTASTTTTDRGFFQLTIDEGDSLVFTHPDYKSGGLTPPEENVFLIYIEQYHFYPSYSEGEHVLYDYLRKHLKYPRKMRNRNEEGAVLIELMIDSAGTISSCQSLNSLRAQCESSIVEVFTRLPGSWSKSEINYEKRLIFPVFLLINEKSKVPTLPDVPLPKGKLMQGIAVLAENP
jgi:hypothetical protein